MTRGSLTGTAAEALEGALAVALLAFLLSLLLTPQVRNAARRLRLLDTPDARRKLHAAPVPRIGGVAVYLSLVVSLMAILPFFPGVRDPRSAPSDGYLSLLIACTAVMLLGLVDDIRGVRPAAKIAVQAGAGLFLCFSGYQIRLISNPLGDPISMGLLSVPVTLIWFVGMSNAFNLIDGLDGLAAGVGFFATTTVFIAALLNGKGEIAILSAALAGALLGFLRYNFNPASIFLGDSGSLMVGFVLAALAIRGTMKSPTAIAVVAPLLAFALPILDALVSMARRALGGKSIFEADGDHIHHRLLLRGLNPRRAVLILYGVAALFSAFSLLTMTSQVLGVVVIAFSVVTWFGIQQLGYPEFAEVRRVFTQGLLNERAVVVNNIYLVNIRSRFRMAPGYGELWEALAEAAGRLGFRKMELSLGTDAMERIDLAATRDDRLRGFPVWQSSRGEEDGAETWSWTMPLLGGRGSMGELRVYRSVTGEPLPFDAIHFLDAVTDAFAGALDRLSEDPMDSQRPERTLSTPTASDARTKGLALSAVALGPKTPGSSDAL